MLKELSTEEKICMFYVSDYHFEMISLPYIRKQMKLDKNILILTEKNLEKSIKKVLENIDINKEEKQNILELNWNEKIENINTIFKEVEQKSKNDIIKNNKNKETIIFIKGNKNYIHNIEENVENILKNEYKNGNNNKNIFDNIQIIDCYDINDSETNIKDISKKYKNILISTGIEKIEK